MNKSRKTLLFLCGSCLGLAGLLAIMLFIGVVGLIFSLTSPFVAVLIMIAVGISLVCGYAAMEGESTDIPILDRWIDQNCDE